VGGIQWQTNNKCGRKTSAVIEEMEGLEDNLEGKSFW
jgi:hypothetical protein